MFSWETASQKVDKYLPILEAMLQKILDRNPGLCAKGADAFVNAITRYIHSSRTIPQDLKEMLEQESTLMRMFGIDKIWTHIRIAVDHPEFKAYTHFVGYLVYNNQEFKDACAANENDLQREIIMEKIRRTLFLYFNGCVGAFRAPQSYSRFSQKMILVFKGFLKSADCSVEDDAEQEYFRLSGREQDRVLHPREVAREEQMELNAAQDEENAKQLEGLFKKYGLNKKLETKLVSKLSSFFQRKRKTRRSRRNRRSTRKH
jgi:hypothetical protein